MKSLLFQVYEIIQYLMIEYTNILLGLFRPCIVPLGINSWLGLA